MRYLICLLLFFCRYSSQASTLHLGDFEPVKHHAQMRTDSIPGESDMDDSAVASGAFAGASTVALIAALVITNPVVPLILAALLGYGALALGVKALKRIMGGHSKKKGKGLAIFGVLLGGLMVMATGVFLLFAILASTALPH